MTVHRLCLASRKVLASALTKPATVRGFGVRAASLDVEFCAAGLAASWASDTAGTSMATASERIRDFFMENLLRKAELSGRARIIRWDCQSNRKRRCDLSKILPVGLATSRF